MPPRDRVAAETMSAVPAHLCYRTDMRFSIAVLAMLAGSILLAQGTETGRGAFENRCGKCHGADGNGGELGPSLAVRLSGQGDGELAALVRVGVAPRRMAPA